MKKILITCLLVLSTAFVAFAQSDLQVIAEVNLTTREPITLGQLKKMVAGIEKTIGRVSTVEQRREVINAMIRQKLILQSARKQGIVINDSEIDRLFNLQLSRAVQMEVTEDDFAKEVKAQTGMSIDEFLKEQTGMNVAESKAYLKDQAISERFILQKYGKEIQASAVPTEQQIVEMYEANQQDFMHPDMAELFVVRVIKNGKTDSEKAKADSLHKRLSGNLSITTKIMEEAKKDPSFEAGFMYIIKNEAMANQMGITMQQLLSLFNSPINQVSEVIEMPSDFQFRVVTKKIPKKFLGLEDKNPLVGATVREQVTAYLSQKLAVEEIQKATEKELKELMVKSNYKILKSEDELRKILAW